jgi:outer membrane beta-barrel protein
MTRKLLRKSPLFVSAVLAVQTVLVVAAFGAEPTRDPAGEDATSEQANRSPAKENSETSNDEYNFSWLDPDKKVYVVQNRKYRKAQRVALFASLGLNLSNPYRTEYVFTPRLSYWFTEQFGLEVFYTGVRNSDNYTLTALKKASPTALPYVRENRSYYGALFTWTPWYSKLNFFNMILYYDWFFNAGVGQVNTAVDHNTRADKSPDFVLENLFAFYYGTGMNFFVTRNWTVRWDLIGMAYSAVGADGVTKSTRTGYDFTLGVGYMF